MATNQDAPFGLKPIGKVGQNRDNQGLSEYDIAASATAIYFNDPVKMKADGTIEVAGAGGAILGSLGGIFFTDATTSKPTFANHLNASNTATDIVGFVSDIEAKDKLPDASVTIACPDVPSAVGILKLTPFELNLLDIIFK